MFVLCGMCTLVFTFDMRKYVEAKKKKKSHTQSEAKKTSELAKVKYM